ncbi:MAG: high-affinity iron transporter [Candidatus Altiarchaeota archaeon]|nr:high-affinity iron transporter [Candidatus Altiarchaeota archaeon]
MVSAFIITLRETLEASLIVGLILSYLKKTNQEDFSKFVWIGVGIGLFGSLAGAYIFSSIYGGFSGTAEKLFEGITMLVGAALLTTLILWISKHNRIVNIHKNVEDHLTKAGGMGLMFLVAISILREGIETIIFLSAIQFSTGFDGWSAMLGILIAIALGYLFFIGAIKLDLKQFFAVTNVILILFAAGLVAHGVHELQEAKAIPIVLEEVWDINPAVVDGEYPMLHDKGAIGGIFKGLFGYNGNPSLIEVLSYLGYLVFAYFIWKRPKRSKS